MLYAIREMDIARCDGLELGISHREQFHSNSSIRKKSRVL